MASKANLRSSGREAALARRHALSKAGKQTVSAPASADRGRMRSTARPEAAAPAQAARPAAPAPRAATSAVRTAVARAPSAASIPSGSALTPSLPATKSRQLARSRRQAMSSAGKRADRSRDRTREEVRTGSAPTSSQAPVASATSECACKRTGSTDSARPAPRVLTGSSTAPSGAARRLGAAGTAARSAKPMSGKPTGRMLALARRTAQSGRGKAAAKTATTTASLARQANPKLSGRELAQTVRAYRSAAGGAGQRKAAPSGRVRPEPLHGQGPAAATDQPWKVGLSETATGLPVTGTLVGRSRAVTGDEPSTCREVTGTEYMGAEIFREFCQTEPPKPVAKVRTTSTARGSRVTGNELGRSTKVTGDEPGACKTVTGTEYLAAEQVGAFCGTTPTPGARHTGLTQTLGGRTVSGVMVGLSPKVTGNEAGASFQPTGSQYLSAGNGEGPGQGSLSARSSGTAANPRPVPPKVATSRTLSGTALTGTYVGRSPKLTGDEPGSCRLVTGDEYVSGEQLREFCHLEPRPTEPRASGLSTTRKGLRVSGTLTGRSSRVTGDEPGTCTAVTGTPYAGLEQAAAYCEVGDQELIAARTPPLTARASQRMTGIRPGMGGVMTGASRGACEDVTGTPYVGADQTAALCEGQGALPGQPDFPRPIEGAPWQSFSVRSPARDAAQARQTMGVTGTRFDQEGRITGPFGLGTGKVTGTEQFRFDRRAEALPVSVQADAADSQAEARSRITGEGQAAGSKITGDDWERGDRVTGTEGPSARRRNPTRPGPLSGMAAMKAKRNEEVPQPVSRVTGSSGSTDRGSLITYSGGARG